METRKSILTKKYHVYVLYNENELTPVYIGMTSNLKSRINSHRSKGKKFDGVLVIESFDNKNDALTCERGIIKFISIFDIKSVVNGKYSKAECVVLFNSYFNVERFLK